MKLFQIILGILIIGGPLLISKIKTVLIQRLFYIIVTLTGFVFIIFPDLSSKIANILGIGRGADLIFYVFMLFSWFWFLAFSMKMRQSDRKITAIVRFLAVENPLKTLETPKTPDRVETE